MSELEFRPRFRFRTPLAADEVKARITAHIAENDANKLILGGAGHHLVLTFPQAKQHAWTPQIDIDMTAAEDGTLMRCLIGPSPSVWMLFMGAYIVITLIALTGLTLGMAQQLVDNTAWGFYLVVPMPFIGLGLWLLVQGGKRRSRDEMHTLKLFVDEALGCDRSKSAEAV